METTIKPPGFQPLHPRYGGRRRRPTALAREIAAAAGIDPLAVMFEWLSTGVYEEIEIGARGAEHRVKRAVPLDMLVDLAKTLASYLHPKLSSVAVTGSGGGPIEATTSAVSAQILMTPELAEAMQKIAFAAAEADMQARAIEAPYTTTE
jgi:hypothetical protein